MRPPLRYIATAVVFVVLVVLFLATYHLPLSAPGHDVASASVGHSINLVDRIFNSTLGVWPLYTHPSQVFGLTSTTVRKDSCCQPP